MNAHRRLLLIRLARRNGECVSKLGLRLRKLSTLEIAKMFYGESDAEKA